MAGGRSRGSGRKVLRERQVRVAAPVGPASRPLNYTSLDGVFLTKTSSMVFLIFDFFFFFFCIFEVKMRTWSWPVFPRPLGVLSQHLGRLCGGILPDVSADLQNRAPRGGHPCGPAAGQRQGPKPPVFAKPGFCSLYFFENTLVSADAPGRCAGGFHSSTRASQTVSASTGGFARLRCWDAGDPSPALAGILLRGERLLPSLVTKTCAGPTRTGGFPNTRMYETALGLRLILRLKASHIERAGSDVSEFWSILLLPGPVASGTPTHSAGQPLQCSSGSPRPHAAPSPSPAPASPTVQPHRQTRGVQIWWPEPRPLRAGRGFCASVPCTLCACLGTHFQGLSRSWCQPGRPLGLCFSWSCSFRAFLASSFLIRVGCINH